MLLPQVRQASGNLGGGHALLGKRSDWVSCGLDDAESLPDGLAPRGLVPGCWLDSARNRAIPPGHGTL
jgi:hypothetical protein